MEIEDLLIKRFSAEKINGVIVAFEDKRGNYRANSAKDVENALTTNSKTDVEVLIGNKWHQIRGEHKVKHDINKKKRSKDWRVGYTAGYQAAKRHYLKLINPKR